MASPDRLRAWCTHIRRIATDAATDVALGGAGDLDRPFRHVVCGESTATRPPDDRAPEVALWWALVDDRIEVPEDAGQTLFPADRYRAIEVWTEAELCGLHALWRLARQRERPDWKRRAERVRDHHLEHTQPDNATNRPWALHVFLLGGSPEHVHYAETLLHNAMASGGTPDPFSAWILLDAASELERAAAY